MVFDYGFCNGSATAAVEEYRRRFPRERAPDKNVFIRVFNKLCETGTLPSAKITSEKADRQTLEEVENILDLVEEDATTSTRRIATQLDISQKRVIHTLHEQGLYPYHLQKVQFLYPEDYGKRVEFCRWVTNNRRVVSRILFTDEATFTRDGINNTHNSHVWSDENPYAIVKTNFQHRFSVKVWCTMMAGYLIGPFIMKNRLTGKHHLNFLINELPGLPLNVSALGAKNKPLVNQDSKVAEMNDLKKTIKNPRQQIVGQGGPDVCPAEIELLKKKILEMKHKNRDLNLQCSRGLNKLINNGMGGFANTDRVGISFFNADFPDRPLPISLRRRSFAQQGIIPVNGYRRADNQSEIALKWLFWKEAVQPGKIILVDENKQICYFDGCSLYPFINKYGKYPVEHPQIHISDKDCRKLPMNSVEGLNVLCYPLQLYNTMYYRINQCIHTDDERKFSGTFVADELRKAISLNYKVLEIYEIWEYKSAALTTRRVLYLDTDSVIFTHKSGEFLPEVGDYLGLLTNGPGSNIIEFVSGGPKNYANKVYCLDKNEYKTFCKVCDNAEAIYVHNSRKICITANYNVISRPENKIYRKCYTKRQRVENSFDTVHYGYNDPLVNQNVLVYHQETPQPMETPQPEEDASPSDEPPPLEEDC
ncbi:unnamed protein product [Brassicogethes aeneus]|uniref:DUF4817 domain-containing protein n=1 Tax=Brassicogethes aeneus TaxID=1431903 RepID=A0A9P0BGS8_BRAAE|nr:unnamed protein product [Brassicogethes aeneus]